MLWKDKVQRHFSEHKQLYAGLGMGLGLAGITMFIMKNHKLSLLSDETANPTYSEQSSMIRPTRNLEFNFHNTAPVWNTVNVIERDGRGHPGYLTRCVEDNVAFKSQKEAALAYGAHQDRMSAHINGRLEHINGKHFEWIIL